jgi:uncharacterized protein YkwD
VAACPWPQRTNQEELLRNLAATVLSVPIVAALVLASAVRRSPASRIAVVVGTVALVGAGAVALAPREASARPSTAATPVVEARLSSVLRTNAGLTDSVTIDFSSPMDVSSVARAIRVDPPALVRLAWQYQSRRLVVTPVRPWAPGTLVTITVGTTAADQVGAVLATPTRASFLTRPEATAAIAATDRVGKRIRSDTAFRITFDRVMDLDSVRAALEVTPAIKGKVTVSTVDGRTIVTFTPAALLRPDTAYTVRLVGEVRDADGAVLTKLPRLAAKTVAAPSVVRFRPATKTTDVDRTAALSIRFTEKMDRARTAKAFRATAAGKSIAGKVTWGEGDTVLVFTPAKPLPWGAKVVMKVTTAARSRVGVALDRARAISFVVEKKPVAKPAVVRAQANSNAAPSTGSSGSSAPTPSANAGAVVGGGSWASVERYYLGLMNCTRTGGWVTSNGSCSSPGGRNVAPIVYDAEISARVARPYAKLMAEGGTCNHFLDGNPGSRLRRAGFASYKWAENIGCPSGDPTRGAVATQLFFQSEKPYNGGHYVNLMNATYTRAGVGVWVHGGNVRIVIDFYAP